MTPRVVSFGAGVQSTVMLLMALDGDIKADCAIFADTGWEPRAVYKHLKYMKQLAFDRGFSIHIVGQPHSIRDLARSNTPTSGRPPLYLRGEKGDGMLRRQCTQTFKIEPLRRRIRSLYAPTAKKPATVLLGISTDEVQRVRTSNVKYIRNEYPLIDFGLSRQDCIRYLADRGINAPRSACIGCPFHSDKEWRRIRDESPDEFADAVAWERELQDNGLGLNATPYLHRQRVPLDEVDLSTLEDNGQLTFNDECLGMCGV